MEANKNAYKKENDELRKHRDMDIYLGERTTKLIKELKSKLQKAEKDIEFHKKRADSLSRFETERVKKIKQQAEKDKEEMLKDIKNILKATGVCQCVDNHKCVVCNAIEDKTKKNFENGIRKTN